MEPTASITSATPYLPPLNGDQIRALKPSDLTDDLIRALNQAEGQFVLTGYLVTLKGGEILKHPTAPAYEAWRRRMMKYRNSKRQLAPMPLAEGGIMVLRTQFENCYISTCLLDYMWDREVTVDVTQTDRRYIVQFETLHSGSNNTRRYETLEEAILGHKRDVFLEHCPEWTTCYQLDRFLKDPEAQKLWETYLDNFEDLAVVNVLRDFAKDNGYMEI